MANKPTEQELIDTLKVVRVGVLELSWDSHVRRMELHGAIEDIDSAIALIEGKGNYSSAGLP
jgi:hypothetical protein